MEVVAKYKNVALLGDVMFINGLRYFVSKYRHINFSTSEFIANAKIDTLMNSILQVVKLYRGRGFNVTSFLMDGQFACLNKFFEHENINLNICSENKHVGDIERHIRKVEERVRCLHVVLPYKRIPGRLAMEMV